MQPLSLLFGSEGNLGVITKALIAIHPKPEDSRYGSLVFRSFGDGIACLRALRAERVLPASIRLVNNREFRFGQALKPAAHGVKAMKDTLQRTLLTERARVRSVGAGGMHRSSWRAAARGRGAGARAAADRQAVRRRSGAAPRTAAAATR